MVRILGPVLIMLILSISLTGLACNASPTVPSSTPEPTPESADSLVKIIVYTDFECGACARLHSEVEPELRRLYVSTGKAGIEVRVLGILDTGSIRAAEAALCAADQGRFLEYQDALFDAWRDGDGATYSTEELLKLAEALGLDVETFRLSLESGSKRGELERNLSLSKADGVHVLPAVIIAGAKVEGYKQLDIYIQLIEQQLAVISRCITSQAPTSTFG